MARFNEAFIFRAAGADPDKRGVREHQLARTQFIAATDAAGAAAIATALAKDGLDLLELYGFGPTAAAQVLAATRGAVPVGLVGVEERDIPTHRAVISPSPNADPARDRYVHEHTGSRMTIVSVPGPEAVPEVAVTLVEEAVERIDVCGGLGPVPAAAAIDAVGNRATVGTVMFGFESLPGVADYRARFEQALAQAN